jgi:L-alanine-DL-glutamate epimerase-like enolase superfamily enzyme
MKKNRRTFLRTAAASVAAPGLVRVATAQSARPNSFPEPVFGGPSCEIPVLEEKTGLKIQSIETFVHGNLGFTRVATDDGSEGWGQVSNYDPDISATILHRKIARYGLGRDPADLEDIVDRAIEGNYKYPWSFVCRATTGLETAVWDLLGKRQGKSVCELLGGKPRMLPVYGSSMSRTITPAQEAERVARLRSEKGFNAFKIRVGKAAGRDQDQWPGRTEEIIPAVRKAVGDDVALLADANSCYTPPKAIEVGRLLEQYGYIHYEEPCPFWELEWTAQVSSVLDIPVAGGEQDNDLAQWRRMIGMHAVDITQPDICYIGGALRALRVARMAQGRGLPCVPHSANRSLVLVFTLHVFGAIPNAGRHVEYTIEEDTWTRDIYEPALQVVDGKVQIPEGPGWGVRINREWLSKAEHRKSEV